MKKAKKLILAFCCALLVGLMVGSMAPAIAYAEPTPTESGTTSDLVNTGVSALGDVQEGLVKIAMTVFAISVIISLSCLFLTHDPKKITTILWVCGIACLAAFGIILANNGTFLKIIEDIANKFSV